MCRGVLSLALLGLLGCASAPQSNHWVLVSQASSSTVAVVDPLQGQVVGRLSVGGLPHRMLVSRDGLKVYVVLVGSQAVAEIDTRSLQVTRTLLTAPVPDKRADGSTIQAHFDQGAFSKTSCFACHNPGGAKPFIVGERPVGIAFSSDESKLWISHIRQARLSQIDLASGRLERSVLLPPSGLAVEAADLARLGSKLVVAMRPGQPSTQPGAVRWLDEQSLNTLSESPTGSDPSFLLPLGSSVLVSNFETNTVSEFAPGLKRAFTVTPGPLGLRLLPGGKQALSLNYYSNAVSILNLETGEAQTLKLDFAGKTYVNPTHAALSPDGRLAYIVSSGTEGNLVVLDLATKQVTRVIPIDGLSFDVVVVRR